MIEASAWEVTVRIEKGTLDNNRTEKLIEFFKTLGGSMRKNGPWKPPVQSEEEYQKEQAEWLKAVRRKKTHSKKRY